MCVCLSVCLSVCSKTRRLLPVVSSGKEITLTDDGTGHASSCSGVANSLIPASAMLASLNTYEGRPCFVASDLDKLSRVDASVHNIYRSVCLSVYLSTHLSIYPSICVCVCVCVCRLVFACFCACWLCMCVCMCVYVRVRMCILTTCLHLPANEKQAHVYA